MSKLKEKNVKLNFPQRLISGAKQWQTKLKPALKNRQLILNAIQSGFYDSNSDRATADKSHPVNLIERGMSILVPYLVMTNPYLLISTKKPEYRPFARTTELAFNHLIKEIKFSKKTLRPVVRDAMMGLGITKTGIMKSHEVEIYGHLHEVGQVYSDRVDVTDYIGDPSALSFEDFEFEGNFYRMPLEAARDLYPKFADFLNPSYALHGDATEESPEKIAHRSTLDNVSTTLKEFVELADFWIPDENVIVTIEPHSSKIIRTIEASTPEGGPYDKLYFKDFPNTPVPIPPVWYWLDLDTAMNVIVNKMRKQAESQKIVLAYEGDAADDAERLAGSGDRQSVKVSNVDGLKPIEWPGVDREQYNWIQYLESQYSLQGNNLYTLGGRNSQAETLGQEQMLMANASKTVDDMTENVYDFAKSVAHKMVWYFWSDPLISVPQIKKIEGFGDIPVTFDRAARDGEFWDYEFDVEPYSMQRLSPMLEYQRILALMSQWVLPTAQIAAQQGYQLNVPAVTNKLAKMSGIREFDEMYSSAVPTQEAKMNPYQPTQGKVKNKDVADGRTGVNSDSAAANSRQKMQSDNTVN